MMILIPTDHWHWLTHWANKIMSLYEFQTFVSASPPHQVDQPRGIADNRWARLWQMGWLKQLTASRLHFQFQSRPWVWLSMSHDTDSRHWQWVSVTMTECEPWYWLMLLTVIECDYGRVWAKPLGHVTDSYWVWLWLSVSHDTDSRHWQWVSVTMAEYEPWHWLTSLAVIECDYELVKFKDCLCFRSWS